MASSGRLTIKKIAQEAGVSVGTVDRVIHSRSNVSPKSYEKVKKVLDKNNFSLNRYASALALSRTHFFVALLPMHETDSYWAKVEKGLIDGINQYDDFNVELKIFLYDPFNADSFKEQCTKLMATNPDMVIVGPINQEGIMRDFSTSMDLQNIPYALIDSNFSNLNYRVFCGQDSISSGKFAGHIFLSSLNNGEKKIALFRMMGEGRVASRQQMKREIGFKEYMQKMAPEIEIVNVNLMVYDKTGMVSVMHDFFSNNLDIHCAITFNSSIHIIADFLRQEMPSHPHVKLLGYDAVSANIRCVENGSVEFLIVQHPCRQGKYCIDAMFKSCLLKKDVERDYYVPIELMTKENIKFYKD